jgi:hypothetical protein
MWHARDTAPTVKSSVPAAQQQLSVHAGNVCCARACHARGGFLGGVGGCLWRVHLPRLAIPVIAPKRSASTSPELSATSGESGSDSSSDGERLPAQQTTRSDRTSRPLNRHVPSPGKLFSDTNEEAAARRASGEAAAAKRQRAAEWALSFPTGAAAVAAVTVASLWLLTILAISTLTAVDNFINAAGGTLPANVWPTGPAGVTFSDAECAELHRLLSLFYNAPGWPTAVGQLVGQPPDSELHAAWAAINELLRSKLLAAGILALFYLACWRVVFRLGDHSPDHQDVEADLDLYGAGGRRCLLSCNAHGAAGQQRSRPQRPQALLYVRDAGQRTVVLLAPQGRSQPRPAAPPPCLPCLQVVPGQRPLGPGAAPSQPLRSGLRLPGRRMRAKWLLRCFEMHCSRSGVSMRWVLRQRGCWVLAPRA